MLATFSIFATWFGAETCIGSSAAVFGGGLSDTRADPFGYTICLFVMGFFFAQKLWSKGLTTIADLYRQEYGNLTEKLAVLVLVPSSIIWAAAQIRAFGQILSVIAPIDPMVAVTVAAAFVIFYTFFGGLMGDVITDIVQGSILIIGLFTLFYFTVSELGGVTEAFARVEPSRWSLLGKGESLLTRVDSWMVPILGSLFSQELISRVFASRSGSIAKGSSFSAAGIYLVIGMIPVSLGLIGVDLIVSPEETDQFLPLLARRVLPTFVFVIFSGALVSAILSTVDSTLLSVSAYVSHNALGSYFNKLEEKARLRFARITILVSGIIAYLMAIGSESIYDLVVAASAFGAAGTITITLAALWFPGKGRKSASVATLIFGVIAHPIFEYVLEVEAPFLFSILGAILTFILFARFSPEKQLA